MTVTSLSLPDPDESAPPGDPSSPFPLRTAAEAGALFGRGDDWMNSLAASGAIPFVDMPMKGGRRRSAQTGRKQRMFRNDVLHRLLAEWTVEA